MNELNKISEKQIFKEQEKQTLIEQENKLKIKNKDFNKINFLNFQHYYDLIKKLKKENININSDFIENISNINYSYKKRRISPLSIKIRKEIEQISHHIYKDKNKNKEKSEPYKKFIDKYQHIINSLNSVSPSMQSSTNRKDENCLIKNIYYILEKEKNKKKNKLSLSINKGKLRNNTVDSIIHKNENKKRIKIEYENYALNNINLNHPQFYILNTHYNNGINSKYKERLPLIETSNGPNIFKYRRTRDLSCFIPFNAQKRKVRDNFYSYYIGMKLSKHNFNS